jgi:Leucine-rich repeat (LRR) protein
MQLCFNNIFTQEDIFSDLTTLTELDLSHNSLASLDNSLFRELQV